jgi:N-6 DNA Methylase
MTQQSISVVQPVLLAETKCLSVRIWYLPFLHTVTKSIKCNRRGGIVIERTVSTMELIKSRKRVVDHGEVFTPDWLVEKMLDLVKGESERIDSRFLEPACGSGNFLVPVLQRKLAVVETKYGNADFERRNYALLSLMCIYGVELLLDNIDECRANLLEIFAEYLGVGETDDFYRAAYCVLSVNLVHGDALAMVGSDRQPISFAEWGYLGRGKFQRRDFRLDALTGSSAFSAEGTLFAHLGKHELFKPTKSYPAMTVKELAHGC